MTLPLLRLALAAFIGIQLTRSLWPRQEINQDCWLIRFLGVGLGMGLLSGLCFAWLLVLPGWNGAFLALEISLAAALAWVRFRRSGIAAQRPSESRRDLLYRVLVAALVLASVLALAGFVGSCLAKPYGSPDAWATYNQIAKFLARSGLEWRMAFSGAIRLSAHSDYPLLLPLVNVGAWGASPHQNGYVPIFVAGIFMASTVGLLISALSRARGIHQGLLAGLVLVATPIFLFNGSCQIADVPLAYFILATLILFLAHDREGNPRSTYLVLAGLACACAAWTKNEGILFFASCLTIRFGMLVWSKGFRAGLVEAGYFLLGAAPILLALIYFKTSIAPANDLVSTWSIAGASEKLADTGRLRRAGVEYFNVLALLKTHILNIPLALTAYLLLVGWNIEKAERPTLAFGAILLASMLAGELVVYLLTPHDISWHVRYSVARLWLQLYPAGLYLYFLIVRSPETSSASLGLPIKTAFK